MEEIIVVVVVVVVILVVVVVLLFCFMGLGVLSHDVRLLSTARRLEYCMVTWLLIR